MNKLGAPERVAIIRCLVGGNSMRSTARITGMARNTIDKLLIDLGSACSQFQDTTFRNLNCMRIQIDEVWTFCCCGQRNVRGGMADGSGDAWTWAAIDPDTKLVPCWVVGKRNPETCEVFLSDIASRLAPCVQLTSDGLAMYYKAAVEAFGEDISYAKLVKIYGVDPEGERRYSPAICTSCEKHSMIGDPDPNHISTSYIERQSLTMRMGIRRFGRLPNAFSKKLANHAAAISLHMMYYNFGRVHQALKTTPVVAAGVADHVWTIEEIVSLLDTFQNAR